MCGDLIHELTVEACKIAAPIIHSQWRGENHDPPEYWMHFVAQPEKIFRAVGDNPSHPRMWEIVRYVLKREGYVVLDAPGTPGRYGPMCSDCWRDESRHPRWAGRVDKMTGPVDCTVCGKPTPGVFAAFGRENGVDIFEW
mgnify:CR=1 FL=1